MIKVYIEKHTIKNVLLDEVDKILNDYITTLNKKFDFYFFNCEFKTEFDNNFTTNIETKYFHQIDSNNIKSDLLYYNDCFKSRGYKVCLINQMTIKTISERCNMTYEQYMNQSMHYVDLRLNMVFDKNPRFINSLDRTKTIF